MKKLGKLFLISLLSLPIFSCANKEEKTLIIQRSYALNDTINLTYSELETKVSSKDDFILYIYDESCEGCLNFLPILKSYIKNYSLEIYSISSNLISTTSSIISYSYTPTLGLFNDGVLENKIDGVSNEKVFSSYSSLETYLNDNIRMSNEIKVTKDNYLALLNSDEEYIILYYWSLCSDCSYMFNNFFNEYLKDNSSITFYGFELSYFYANRSSSSDPFWTNFTKEVGLSKEGSLKGYNSGVVPTFQHRKNKNILDAVVIFNDEYTKVTNDNGEIEEITITSSYYESSPYIGKTYKKDNDVSAVNKYREDTSTFYFNKIKDLFNKIK